MSEIKTAQDIVDAINRDNEEYRKANDAAIAELKANGKVSAETEAKMSKMDAALVAQSEQLDTIKSQMERTGAMNDVDNDIKTREEAIAFKTFLETGEIKSDYANTTTGADGGYAVPTNLSTRLSQLVVASSPVRQLARVVNIGTGNTYKENIDLNNAASGWTTQTGSRAATVAGKLGQVSIAAEEMYANAEATQQSLDDLNFNTEEFIVNSLVNSFARLESTAFVSGSGSGQPTGFLTTTKVTTPGTYEFGKLNNIETAAVDTIATDDLINLVYGIPAQYASRGAFGLNRLMLRDIRKLKDGNNNYIWQPSLVVGQPSTLLGAPVYEMADMAATHTNGGGDTDAVIFADWQEFYLIVDRVGMTMLRDPFSNKPFVQFYATKRVGGKIFNAKAGVVLTVNDA